MPVSKKNLVFSQLKVGVFALAALAVLGLLILNSTGDFNPFQKKMHLKARFASADGLREGGEVQFAGVHIGKVEAVRFLPPDSPETEKLEAILSVVTTLDGTPITERIRTDSTAQLIATSVVGNDKMINITPGTVKGNSVSENHVLESSTAISINQLTQTGNDLLEQINKLSIPANEILNKANRGEGTLGKIINDQSLYNGLDATVGEAKLTMLKIQTILEQVKSGNGTAGKLLNDPALYNSLNKTIAQLEGISTDLRAGKGTAGKFLTDEALYNDVRATLVDVKASIARVNGIADDVKLMTKDLNDGKGTAGKFLKDDKIYNDATVALGKFNTLAEKLDLMLNDLQAGKGTAGKILKDETLYNNINQTTSNVNQLSSEATKMIYDFRQNPKKYLTIQFKLF
ncbi:MAG TPA: MlaD family protein [Pyrinomonadaceae bacterium]|nr:MlaD family protein [Pyrinomonadaceae bacterium]